MALKLLAGALAALLLAQTASAQIIYTYTGAKFNNVNVQTILDPEVPPEQASLQSAAAKAILLNDQLVITLTSPVYLPSGWTTIDPTGIYGQLAAPLSALPPPGTGIGWTLINTAFSTNGQTLLDNVMAFDPSIHSRFSASLHVGASNVIDAWDITVLPSDAYSPPNWHIAVGSSSVSGDTLLYEFGASRYYQRREATVDTPGSWAVSGGPMAAVAEPDAITLLLGGLALTGVLSRKRRA